MAPACAALDDVADAEGATGPAGAFSAWEVAVPTFEEELVRPLPIPEKLMPNSAAAATPVTETMASIAASDTANARRGVRRGGRPARGLRALHHPVGRVLVGHGTLVAHPPAQIGEVGRKIVVIEAGHVLYYEAAPGFRRSANPCVASHLPGGMGDDRPACATTTSSDSSRSTHSGSTRS